MSCLLAKFVWTERMTSESSGCRLEYFSPWLVSRRCGQPSDAVAVAGKPCRDERLVVARQPVGHGLNE